MSENDSLHIHAKILPRQPIREETAAQAPDDAAVRVEEHPARGRRRRRARPSRSRGARASRGDRLLRNSAIACAILLGILALGNLDAPWAKKASEGIERALTMHIDLDESIGALQFVKNLMPESALVFMNLGGGVDAVPRPVEGAVSHAWSNLQPWMMFKCADAAEVKAIGGGTVTAVSSLSDGRYGLLVDHGDGMESLYACLSDAAVDSGDSVERGQTLGSASESLYFEYRSGGESIDPAPLLGL